MTGHVEFLVNHSDCFESDHDSSRKIKRSSTGQDSGNSTEKLILLKLAQIFSKTNDEMISKREK